MKHNILLITGLLSTTILFGVTACDNKADSITSHNSKTMSHPGGETSGQNARDIAEDFVGHINYARISLARNKGDRAEAHIVEARNLVKQMQNTTPDEHEVSEIESGRVVYKYNTHYNNNNDYKYHYFPIDVGPMEIKKMSHGPIWAKEDLAVTDADVVYLTVDLSGDKAEKRLNKAEDDIKAGHLKAADMQLAKLTDEVVTVDSKVAVPLDKARDNIILTRDFVAAGNYAGARYSLKHADDALNEMQNSDDYQTHSEDIITMRHEVKHLMRVIASKDPSMTQKAVSKLDKWWSQLKDWSNS